MKCTGPDQVERIADALLRIGRVVVRALAAVLAVGLIAYSIAREALIWGFLLG